MTHSQRRWFSNCRARFDAGKQGVFLRRNPPQNALKAGAIYDIQ